MPMLAANWAPPTWVKRPAACARKTIASSVPVSAICRMLIRHPRLAAHGDPCGAHFSTAAGGPAEQDGRHAGTRLRVSTAAGGPAERDGRHAGTWLRENARAL